MKTGRSLQELAGELERQIDSKHDYKAPTRALEMITEVVSPLNDGKTVTEVRFAPKSGTAIPELALTPWAHQQVAQDLDIPKPYYDRMLKDAPHLLAENVNTWLDAENRIRLVRTLDGKARAWLSDRYRPLDNFDLAHVALPVLTTHGGIQVESAELTDTRLYIKSRLTREQAGITLTQAKTMVHTASRANELLGMVVILRNSEVGHGAVGLEFGLWVQGCTNLLISNAALRKFHVGRAGNGDREDIEEFLTDDTRRLDDRAFWAKFGDTLRGAFAPANFTRMLEKAQQAANSPIESTNLPQVVEVTREQYRLTDTEAGGILTYLAQGGDMSQWGLAQAITRMSQDVPEYERATELERLGGTIIELPKTDWARISQAN